MINIINKLNNLPTKEIEHVILNNKSLITDVSCYSTLCSEKIVEFANAFNELYNNKIESNNKMNVYIHENDIIFDEAQNLLNNTDLIQTYALEKFNKATITTSLAKCTKDKNYYIMRCYEYFIYIFDKKNKNCYMIVKNNKKAITMVNILLLTPYLMYKELYAVHGGLVNKENKNILINNASLGGKTTFAILFASHGWNIVTEETTYITSEGVIFPFNIRNYFNIRAGTYLAFKDFFLNKNIKNDFFLSLSHMSNDELFKLGKDNQFSIDFDEIGSIINGKNNKITHSIKVSIANKQDFEIKKAETLENVNSFLELSLAPTVLLFTELLNYSDIDKEERKRELETIFKNTKSFILKSGFSYKENYDYIINELNL